MARSSRPPPPEEDDDEQQPSNVLQFNEPLSWKAGKPIPTGTLITRLKALSKELIALEQEAVDRDSLATPARELVAVALLQHKDSGVKAYAACCLADMLRLHAPDAPYTALQLKVCFLMHAIDFRFWSRESRDTSILVRAGLTFFFLSSLRDRISLSSSYGS